MAEFDRWAEEEPADTRAVTKIPGLTVRMNATVALARRGSAAQLMAELEAEMCRARASLA